MENTSKVEKSKFAIVNAVVVALNLGDYGKVENTVIKTAKKLKREVETAERSILNAKHNYTSKKSEMDEKLEDAEQAVDDSYTNLDPKQLKTNEMQRAFIETYLSSIDTAEAVVVGIEDKMKEQKEAYDVKVKGYKDQIAVREKRINRLEKGNK